MDYKDVSETVVSVDGVNNKIESVSDKFSSLEYIDKGINRLVFQVDSDLVLKVPRESDFTLYNQLELYNYKSLVGTRFESWLAPVHIKLSDSKGSFLLMDSVDMSVNCEQKVAANVSEAFTTVETGLDNFGKHSEQGEVAVDYTEPIDSYYRCDSYPSI